MIDTNGKFQYAVGSLPPRMKMKNIAKIDKNINGHSIGASSNRCRKGFLRKIDDSLMASFVIVLISGDINIPREIKLIVKKI
ncbi:hypothetical protein VAWG005_15250 [Aeromonas dhakensis]|nr:hypothetical protein VAWG003_15210 [Aeromonas dhakensis]BEE25597.1 hypothetical protein VAWG005_15250 [Aeromonas dhakensis]